MHKEASRKRKYDGRKHRRKDAVDAELLNKECLNKNETKRSQKPKNTKEIKGEIRPACW